MMAKRTIAFLGWDIFSQPTKVEECTWTTFSRPYQKANLDIINSLSSFKLGLNAKKSLYGKFGVGR